MLEVSIPQCSRDEGLDAAVQTLADRAPLPVAVHVAVDRLPPHVETTIYFLVSEALNVVKHARATHPGVEIARRGAGVTVTVADDGIGDATMAPTARASAALSTASPRRRASADRERFTDGDAADGGDPMLVVIADDAALLRHGLARLLEEAGVEVCGVAEEAGSLLTLVEASRPDVAIVDIRMPPTRTDKGSSRRTRSGRGPWHRRPRALAVRGADLCAAASEYR